MANIFPVMSACAEIHFCRFIKFPFHRAGLIKQFTQIRLVYTSMYFLVPKILNLETIELLKNNRNRVYIKVCLRCKTRIRLCFKGFEGFEDQMF